MRAMSFMLTTEQILNETKTVTRRLNWLNLKPGTQLRAVRKAMGLAKGEKQEFLKTIEVVAVERQFLDDISKEDVIREGFPNLSPRQFVDKFCKAMNCAQRTIVTVIEFKYVKDVP